MSELSRILAALSQALPLAAVRTRGDPAHLHAARFVACVPARNEEQRIDRCLQGLDAELDPSDGVLLVANGCRDKTASVAARRMMDWRRPWLLVDCDWREGTGTAPLARRLALDLAHAIAPNAALLSVDGDTLVLPGLRAAYAADFERGFGLVCGRIGFLPEEASLLPPAADRDGQRLVRFFRDASRELAARILPDPHNPWPHHGNIGGANFAISADAYRRAGPLPTPASAEDRALRRRCEALDVPIRYSEDACVQTSCRLDGRAQGGLADELRRDRIETDPIVDEALEPAATLLLRLQSRRDFRLATEAHARFQVLCSLALEPNEAQRLAERGDGLAWMEAEDLSPRLFRTRLRLSDLRRHHSAMRQALLDTPRVPSGTPSLPEVRAS